MCRSPRHGRRRRIFAVVCPEGEPFAIVERCEIVREGILAAPLVVKASAGRIPRIEVFSPQITVHKHISRRIDVGGQSAVRRPDMPRPDTASRSVEQPDKGVASDGRTRAEADAAAVVAHIAYDSPLRRSRLPDKAGGCPFEFLRRDARGRSSVALHRCIEQIYLLHAGRDVAVGRTCGTQVGTFGVVGRDDPLLGGDEGIGLIGGDELPAAFVEGIVPAREQCRLHSADRATTARRHDERLLVLIHLDGRVALEVYGVDVRQDMYFLGYEERIKRRCIRLGHVRIRFGLAEQFAMPFIGVPSRETITCVGFRREGTTPLVAGGTQHPAVRRFRVQSTRR